MTRERIINAPEALIKADVCCLLISNKKIYSLANSARTAKIKKMMYLNFIAEWLS